MATRNLNHSASLERDIHAALHRIQEGVYGLCVDCDEPISPKRLEAVPWASRCLSCQENAEIGGAQDAELAA
jgi:DnaK suppressor protein